MVRIVFMPFLLGHVTFLMVYLDSSDVAVAISYYGHTKGVKKKVKH
jgi:hypothetical protein